MKRKRQSWRKRKRKRRRLLSHPGLSIRVEWPLSASLKWYAPIRTPGPNPSRRKSVIRRERSCKRGRGELSIDSKKLCIKPRWREATPNFSPSRTELHLDRISSKWNRTLTKRSDGRTYSRVVRFENGVPKDRGLIAEVGPHSRALSLSDCLESRGNGRRGLQVRVRRMRHRSRDWTVETLLW